MSQNTKISSEEKDSKIQNTNSFFFKNILTCKCGQFHEFKFKFMKEYYILFPCCTLKLIEINNFHDFHSKCNDCKTEIFIEKDYYEKTNTDTIFICEECSNKYTEKQKSERKLYLISNINEKDDIRRNSISTKFKEFINNNGKIIRK